MCTPSTRGGLRQARLQRTRLQAARPSMPSRRTATRQALFPSPLVFASKGSLILANRKGPISSGLFYFGIRISMLHRRFDVRRFVWKLCDQVDKFALLIDVEHVLDTNSDSFFGDVDSWLNREHIAFIQRLGVVHRIVHVDANRVSQTMQEVLAERLAVQVFAMRIDVVVGDFIERVRYLGTALIHAAKF